MKVKTSKQFINNFLMKSSLSFRGFGLMERLLGNARQAYFARDYIQLEKDANALINLSPRTEFAGLWYSVLANRKLWKERTSELANQLTYLADNGTPVVRAAAMSSLVAQDIISGKADNHTKRLIHESSSLSLRNNDLIIFVQTQSQLSLLCSMNGDNKESLEILRGLQPAVQFIGRVYDVVPRDFYNSVAYELNQLGNHHAAKYFINFSLNSSHLKAYPEWLETAKDINDNLRPSSSLVAYNNISAIESNVLLFPIKKSTISAMVKAPLYIRLNSQPVYLCDYPTNKLSELITFARSQSKATPILGEIQK